MSATDQYSAIFPRDTRKSLVRVRGIDRTDCAQWRSLWQQYLQPTQARSSAFYLQPPGHQVVDATFEKLVDPNQQPHALVAVHGDKLIGFAHYLFHPSTWSLKQVCYLEDLYVEPSMRRAGVGRALIRALYAAADQADAGGVYWLTHESNTAAQALFETLARTTGFARYER